MKVPACKEPVLALLDNGANSLFQKYEDHILHFNGTTWIRENSGKQLETGYTVVRWVYVGAIFPIPKGEE